MDKKLLLVALLVAVVEVKGSPLSPGVWEDHLRVRREKDTFTGTTVSSGDEATPEPTSPSRSRREADKKDCSEDLKSTCKADSCPMDDSSMEKCCKCYETCCSSDSSSKEGSTSEPEPSSEPSSIESATDSAKKYLNETATNVKQKAENAATKVEGWFKNVGQSIKEGVGTAVDKVKTTAHSVKESAKSGINKAADWVKNKTSGEEKDKSSSCMEGKTAKGALTTTPTNVNSTVDAVNCTVETVSKKSDEMTGGLEDDSETTTEKRNRRSSEEEPEMNSTTVSSGGTNKVPGMQKSKRSLVEDPEDSLEESSMSLASRIRRAADEGTTMTAEGSTDDSATEAAEESTTQGPSKSPTIIIQVSGDKSSRYESPIRAPGSVDPQEATLNKNSTTRVSYGLNVIHGQGSGGVNNVEISAANRGFIKAGRCRPLSQGLKCIALSRDASQCSYDAMCPDSKKCCFYACQPNADVGICEHPVFS